MADHEFTRFQRYYVKCKDSSIWFKYLIDLCYNFAKIPNVKINVKIMFTIYTIIMCAEINKLN